MRSSKLLITIRKKRKHCPYKPGSVPHIGVASAIYLIRRLPYGSSILPSIAPNGIGRTALRRWFTRTCSLQTGQHDDYPPPGELLPHLLTLTQSVFDRGQSVGGHSLLPAPAVTSCWHFHQWSVLCCPDFPLVPYKTPAADRDTAFCLQKYKEVSE